MAKEVKLDLFLNNDGIIASFQSNNISTTRQQENINENLTLYNEFRQKVKGFIENGEPMYIMFKTSKKASSIGRVKCVQLYQFTSVQDLNNPVEYSKVYWYNRYINVPNIYSIEVEFENSTFTVSFSSKSSSVRSYTPYVLLDYDGPTVLNKGVSQDFIKMTDLYGREVDVGDLVIAATGQTIFVGKVENIKAKNFNIKPIGVKNVFTLVYSPSSIIKVTDDIKNVLMMEQLKS